MERAEGDRTLVEVAALRREIAELRAEQRSLSEQVEEMTRTFRAIATQLGIVAEPYRRATKAPEPDRSGFA